MVKKKLHLDILEVKVDNSHDLTIRVGPCGGGGDSGSSVTLDDNSNSDTCTPMPGLPPTGGDSAGGNSGPCM